FATTYYKYGRTLADGNLHWYEFLYDNSTGAEVRGNRITLHFVDGQRGDDDRTVNGVIVEPGGPASNGNITLRNAATFEPEGEFINIGTVSILDTSVFTVSGPANTFTQQSPFGITQVDGTLTADQLNIIAGFLLGSGTVNGDITIWDGAFLLPGDF